MGMNSLSMLGASLIYLSQNFKDMRLVFDPLKKLKDMKVGFDPLMSASVIRYFNIISLGATTCSTTTSR
jgi:hypothetical protein